MITIDLMNEHNAGLIVAGKSGVMYTNQTGGTMCNHPELEGTYLPLARIPQLEELADVRIDPEVADRIDAVLPQWVRVDRVMLHASEEAWVWVLVRNSGAVWGVPEYGVPAVLTWQNSD